ncbi:hypothetical protein AGIG_G22695 [Arapaima gigas]
MTGHTTHFFFTTVLVRTPCPSLGLLFFCVCQQLADRSPDEILHQTLCHLTHLETLGSRELVTKQQVTLPRMFQYLLKSPGSLTCYVVLPSTSITSCSPVYLQ